VQAALTIMWPCTLRRRPWQTTLHARARGVLGGRRISIVVYALLGASILSGLCDVRYG
jgi:hypothetical protein